MKFTTVVALLASAFLASVAAAPVAVSASVALAEEALETPAKAPIEPTLNVTSDPAEASVRSYIIVLKDTVVAQDIAKAEQEIVKVGGTIKYRYTTALKGFSAWLSTRAAHALQSNPLVSYIEEDKE
ncbi:hypothetical protein BGX34_002087, partial [Mortierella sp. NVP85]